MKLGITKACADSLRNFTQNNYGIQLKSAHAHELVAAYFGYTTKTSLLADKQHPIENLEDAEFIVLQTPVQLVNERLATLENLPEDLPSPEILSQGVYAAIMAEEKFSSRAWTDVETLAVALADVRAFEDIRMMGMDPKELDWLINTNIQETENNLVIKVSYEYPAKTQKPLRHALVKITLPRVAGCIGFGEPRILPTFDYGHFADPDFRAKNGYE